MAADPIIYCLCELTDYGQFERMAHDILVTQGYSSIEPLGGFKDKGRDAVHRSADGGFETVFAYSVREDWRDKLDEDAEKVKKHGHPCSRLVFLSTAIFTASERDNAIADIKSTFGWELDLYGIERLRVLLAGPCRHVVTGHPQIFTPPFFPQVGGLSLVEAPDHLIIDHADADEPLASWLTRRLRLAGYKVWSRTLAPIAGISIDETVTKLLQTRTAIYLPILSPAALHQEALNERRVVAINSLPGNVVPLVATAVPSGRLDRKSREIEHIEFQSGWASGLARLHEVISSRGVHNSTAESRIVLESLMPPDVIETQPERVISNRFRVLSLPDTVRGYSFSRSVSKDAEHKIKQAWPCRRVSEFRFLSFQPPPKHIVSDYGVLERGGAVWKSLIDVEGIRTDYLVSELVRRSIERQYAAKGLRMCEQKGYVFFPEGLCKSDRFYFTHPDGSRTFVNVCGERKLYRPNNRSTNYRYHLSPDIRVKVSPDGEASVSVRVQARVTDTEGNLYIGRNVISRRKHLGKQWFNNEWLVRTVAMMQFLSEEDSEEIRIPTQGDECIVISAKPEEWMVPVRIVEAAIVKAKRLAEEAVLYARDDDQYDDEDEVPPGSPEELPSNGNEAEVVTEGGNE